MPQLPQGAVTVYYALAIPYLWTARLCVIQDDEKDRAIALPQMSLIYQQSVLTICAAHACKAADEFLDDHSLYQDNFRPAASQFRNTGTSKSPTSELRKRIVLDSPYVVRELAAERAWMLQEHLPTITEDADGYLVRSDLAISNQTRSLDQTPSNYRCLR